jgi:tetratricopeptide (TPR) repeat protein
MRRVLITIGSGFLLIASLVSAFAETFSTDRTDCAGNDDDKSIAACTRIIQRIDQSAEERVRAFINRGISYRRKGDPDQALADYDEATRLDPGNARVHRLRGNAYHAKGDFARASAAYAEAIHLDPGNADGYNGRCWNGALAGGPLHEALADCNVSVRLDPNSAETINSRGLVRLKLGAFREAIADYSAAIALNARDANSLYGRGVAKLKSGDAASGNADIAAAKAIDAKIDETYAQYGIKLN